MKIGIDTRLINQTGVGRYTNNLINNLAKIDKKNFYTLFLGQEEYNSFSLPGINFEKKLTNFRWHSLEEQLRFPKILEKENFDLVHFPYFSVPVAYKGKYIVTIHDLILDHFDTGKATTLPLPVYKLKRLGYKYILNKAIQNSIKIIAVSKATKEEITNHYKTDPNKITVIYEAPGFTKMAKRKKTYGDYFIRNKLDYFLYVGNAYPHKNLNRLIEAFKLLNNNNQRLVLAGPNDYFYEKLKQKEKSKNIIFKNSVNDEELSCLYRNARVLIMPSLMEGFGLTILEAMQYDLHIVASRIPSIKEIAGNSIKYFNPLNSKDIASSIEEILAAKKEVDYKSILSKFSWLKTAKETLKVYSEAVAKGKNH